jgi:hypothetical protein
MNTCNCCCIVCSRDVVALRDGFRYRLRRTALNEITLSPLRQQPLANLPLDFRSQGYRISNAIVLWPSGNDGVEIFPKVVRQPCDLVLASPGP